MKLVGIVAASLALAACSSPQPTPASDPIELRLVDCRERDGADLPCVTFDGTTWFWVQSQDPDVRTDLVQCGVEDGGPILPCVWRNRDQDGKWIIFIQDKR